MNAPISHTLPTASPASSSALPSVPTDTRMASGHWHASLQLGFAARPGRDTSAAAADHDAGSFLTHRLHYGPLRVQRPLYPEGPRICHAVIVHPPGGVAGGDSLHIDVDVGVNSHAVLATPGSTKWYKSNQRSASQQITLRVKDGARLDWLPQNNIVFDAARANLDLTAEIAPNASAIGWETTQLGRQTSGERWKEGQLHASTTLQRPNGELLWTERALLDASDPLREWQQGLNGWNAFGTLWAIAATDRGIHDDAPIAHVIDGDFPAVAGSEMRIDAAVRDPIAALIDALNARLTFEPHAGERSICAAVTRLPNGVILIRAVAHRMETLQTCFIQCWEVLRPAIHGVAARPLRLWST